MEKTQGRFARTWWPTINNITSAKKAAHTGAWYAVFMGVATGILITLNVFGVTDNFFGLNASNYADSALCLILAFFIYRMSRAAALLMLAYFIGGKVLQFADGQGQGQLIPAVFFGLFYVNALRGALAYHRLLDDAAHGLAEVKPVKT